MNPELINGLTLAYIGDSVLEVLVREYLVKVKGIVKVNELQKTAIKYVSAKPQASFIKACKEGLEVFTEQEWDIYRRGRNSKSRHRLKNTDIASHNESSGFEAVFGLLHLMDNEKRIHEIFDQYILFIEGEV